MPALLLILFSVSISIGAAVVVAVIRSAGNSQQSTKHRCPIAQICAFRRPGCWLAVKSRNLLAVQSALGLHNVKPCSWFEGLAGEGRLFISPPVKGWILVMGSGLPDPSEDVDACFRFLMTLSRKLGQVQFFSASSILRHHAWVKVEKGRVLRAYAWAGRTLWHEGCQTSAERLLDLKCFDYGGQEEEPGFTEPQSITANVDKVPLLAARWSLDPARIDERFTENETGIAGEPTWRF